TPAAGNIVIYALDDGNVYSKDDAGTIVNLSAAAGTGTTNATLIIVTNSPVAYTPDDTFVEGHLKGVDDALAALGAWSPIVVNTADDTVTPIWTNTVPDDVTHYIRALVIGTRQTNSVAFRLQGVANNTDDALIMVAGYSD